MWQIGVVITRDNLHPLRHANACHLPQSGRLHRCVCFMHLAHRGRLLQGKIGLADSRGRLSLHCNCYSLVKLRRKANCKKLLFLVWGTLGQCGFGHVYIQAFAVFSNKFALSGKAKATELTATAVVVAMLIVN